MEGVTLSREATWEPPRAHSFHSVIYFTTTATNFLDARSALLSKDY